MSFVMPPDCPHRRIVAVLALFAACAPKAPTELRDPLRAGTRYSPGSAPIPDGLGGKVVDVRGSFTAPGKDERFVVAWGGPTNGASGGRTAYVFPSDGATKPTRTITSFPATRCVPISRAGRSTLVLCSMFATWQGVSSGGLALFDASLPLHEDMVKGEGDQGWLAPLATFFRTDFESEADALPHTCPGDVFPMAVTPEIQELSSVGEGASLRVSVTVVAPISADAQTPRLCKKADTDARTDRVRIWKIAETEIGPPTRIVFTLSPTPDGLAIDDEGTVLRRLAAFGFKPR